MRVFGRAPLPLGTDQVGKADPVTAVTSPSTFLPPQVDVFAYGIILCEIIARIEADPDILPRTEVGAVARGRRVLFPPRVRARFTVYRLGFQDFGLDVDAFARMVGDCPAAFFNLAVTCCNVGKIISQIVLEYSITAAVGLLLARSDFLEF